MREKLLEIREKALALLGKCFDEKALGEIKVKYLGKQGELTSILRGMRDVSQEDRPKIGALVNDVRNAIEAKVTELTNRFAEAELNRKLQSEKIDITLPGLQVKSGAPSILEKLVEEVEEVFMSMGYDVVDGPEVEEDRFNFEMLNIPKGHPARDAQDTFYIEDEKVLLRSQTSPVQVRTMLAAGGNTPIRMICPGKTYRRDSDDATHSHQFMQIEGLVVDKIDRNISMSDLKGTLEALFKKILDDKTQVRFRPSYYQFTEPSVEVDVTCCSCKGKGCSMCKNTGWLTVCGAGIVHPNVLRNCGYDPKEWSGFAFGFGAERVAMVKYGMTDIRKLDNQTDLRETSAFDRREG